MGGGEVVDAGQHGPPSRRRSAHPFQDPGGVGRLGKQTLMPLELLELRLVVADDHGAGVADEHLEVVPGVPRDEE